VLDYSTFGQSWLPNSAAGVLQWNGCAMSASGQYITATANASGLWYSSNYGQSWTQISNATIPTAANIASIAISGLGQYQVAASTVPTYGIYYSSTYGTTWTQASGTTSITWAQICMSISGQYASAAPSASNYIYYSSNYGQTWTSTTSSVQGAYGGIACSASGQYQVAAITSGGIYYSTNYGITWTLSNISSSGTTGNGGMSASGQYAIFPSSSSGMYLSTNYGITWTLVTGVIAALPLSRACMSASGQYQIVSSNSLVTIGGVCYSTNYGQTWSTYPMTNANGWASTAISANGQYAMVCAYSGQLYMSIVRFPSFYTSQLTYPTPFSVATPGWTTLPGGITLQWGSFTFSTPQTVQSGSVTFPKAFRSASYSISVTLNDTGIGSGFSLYEPMAYNLTTTGFEPYIKQINGGSLTNSAIVLYWLAYGL
jgi:hypothetical protein